MPSSRVIGKLRAVTQRRECPTNGLDLGLLDVVLETCHGLGTDAGCDAEHLTALTDLRDLRLDDGMVGRDLDRSDPDGPLWGLRPEPNQPPLDFEVVLPLDGGQVPRWIEVARPLYGPSPCRGPMP